jgi:hypothetical protein
MKKTFLLFTILFFICFFSKTNYAQSPSWLWAKNYGGTADEYGYATTVDIHGNIYVTGCFYGHTMVFGNDTLINNSTSDTSDIFIVKYDANGDTLWAKSAGGSNYDYAYSIAVDDSGKILICGMFNSSAISFDSITLNKTGYSDLFIAKYDSNGDVLWARNTIGNGIRIAISVATDNSGNAYIAGSYQNDAVTFGTITLNNAGSGDIFLVKYDVNGTVVWAKNACTAHDEYAYSISLDNHGNIYVAGDFWGETLTIDTTTLINHDNSGNSTDIFLAKYDSGGNVLWAKSYGNTDVEFTGAISTDSIGNTSFVGYNVSQILQGCSLKSANKSDHFDSFILRFNNNGNVLWGKKVIGSDEDVAISVATDHDANTFVTGWFLSDTLHFDALSIRNAGLGDIFLAKYDQNGNVVWAKSVGGTARDFANSIAVDNAGNGFLTGSFKSNTLAFGNTTLINAGGSDIFLAKINTYSGIIEFENSDEMSVFPNPSSGYINILTPDKGKLEIFNIAGQLMESFINAETAITINTKKLPSGIYIIKATMDKGIATKKFIKQ